MVWLIGWVIGVALVLGFVAAGAGDPKAPGDEAPNDR
jgi:hypothetical protein